MLDFYVHNFGTSLRVTLAQYAVRPLKLNKRISENLTFRGLCIVIYSYNKTNEMHHFLKFIFGI